MSDTEKLANGRDVLDHKKLDIVLGLVMVEILHAHSKHPKFPTPHHGHSVILEELDELFDEIKLNRGTMVQGRKEAAQVAASAIRYIYDLCDMPTPTNPV